MSKRSQREWLSDIVSWGERMQRHIRGVERAKFLQDEMVQDAVAKCIEALGEAAGQLDDLDPQLDRTIPGLNLKLARRMRDRMTHGYYKIDWRVVFDSACTCVVRRPSAACVLAGRH